MNTVQTYDNKNSAFACELEHLEDRDKETYFLCFGTKVDDVIESLYDFRLNPTTTYKALVDNNAYTGSLPDLRSWLSTNWDKVKDLQRKFILDKYEFEGEFIYTFFSKT